MKTLSNEKVNFLIYFAYGENHIYSDFLTESGSGLMPYPLNLMKDDA